MRERAHPWWGERVNLDPNHYDPGWGDGSISFTVRAAPLCENCGEDITGHYRVRCGSWMSEWFCKRPCGDTEATVVWKQAI